MTPDVWAEIDQNAIKNNYQIIRKNMSPETGIIAVVKSNAYGHGLVEVAEILAGEGCEMFAVTSMDEAVTLRQHGISQSVLNLSYTASSVVEEAINRRITATVFDLDSATRMHQIATNLHKPLKVHVKVDTGMSRLGVLAEDAPKLIADLIAWPYFRVEGIYSHFADESDNNFVNDQYQKMQDVLFNLQKMGRVVPAVHMAKSRVLFKSSKYHFDAVRPGMALYGYGYEEQGLLPAMAIHTVIAQIKRVPKGSKIGYMQTHMVDRDTLIGILPLGYAHGYDRGLSNVGHVLIDGWKCPIIGRICMAQTIVDLSPVRSSSKLTVGQEVVVIGKQKNQEITVKQIADWLGTNTYEIVTRIPESVYREYV